MRPDVCGSAGKLQSKPQALEGSPNAFREFAKANRKRAEGIIPEGWLRIARRFNAGSVSSIVSVPDG